MKKFFLVLFCLILIGGAGFSAWYFFLREEPLLVEFYGDQEVISYLSGDGEYKKNKIVTLTAEERAGYDFESWIKDGVAISSSRIYTFVMSDQTCGKYTATYKAKEFSISTQNNGVYNIANKALTDEMVEININLPTGYALEEAYYVIEGTEEKVMIKNNQFKMPPGHISIFIKIEEIKYQINYNLNEGFFNVDPISTFTINTPRFALPEPERRGFDFVGYTTEGNSTPQKEFYVEQGTTENVVVYAEWEPSTYSID